jgi:hypothetical protein
MSASSLDQARRACDFSLEDLCLSGPDLSQIYGMRGDEGLP